MTEVIIAIVMALSAISVVFALFLVFKILWNFAFPS